MTKKLLLVFLVLFTTAVSALAHDLTLKNVPAQIYFSPNGGATAAVVHEINNAKSEILVAAYSFTSAPIAKALTDAFKRGVKVEAILDESQNTKQYSAITYLTNAGIPTFIDVAHSIFHNKVLTIDNETVVFGSMNFTKAGEEKNAENLMVLKSRELAALYKENWIEHRNHSNNIK